MAHYETSHCCPSPVGSYTSGGNRFLLPFLGQREFPWEKTSSSLWVSGCLPKPFAKRLLEARTTLAQKQIALQQRDCREEQRWELFPFLLKKKERGRGDVVSKQSIIVVLKNLITFDIYKKDPHHSKEHILANFTDYASGHGEFCLYWFNPGMGMTPEMLFRSGSCFA